MQEYWESYIKPVDGHKAIVSFNAGVSDFVPDEQHIYVGFVKVKLNKPNSEGLVSKDEEDDVKFIEDRIEMESLRWRSGKYIGRIISNGEVNFIYYLKLDFEWSNTVFSAMGEFKDYKYEYGSRLDMEWEVYKKLLFPTIKEWQIIANHHSCDSLKEQGDALITPRAIEHKSYFKNLKDRENFITLITKEGFKEQTQTEVDFRDETMYGVIYYRIDNAEYYNIDEITIKLIDLSIECNGNYDGWESSLVK